ncbi:cytochrome c peroxidase [Azospirillum sp. sgz302134]
MPASPPLRSRTRSILVAGVMGAALAGAASVAISAQRAGAPEAAPADPAYYARPAAVPFPVTNGYSAAKAALGERLFHDTALSGAGDRACASCHEPGKGFQDGRARADGLDGAPLGRRTPFVADAAWGERFFWDGRAASLEEQALGPVQNPREMNQTLDGMVKAISAKPDYAPLFAAAFPEDPRITAANAGKAIATFERTIQSGETAFDRWVAGDAKALSDGAKRGFELFTGKAGCASCHSGWGFTDHAFHDIGLPDEDKGRGVILNEPSVDHAFKTPSLRNVGRRAPYMHDGSMATLEAVLDHYAGKYVDRPTLSPDLPRLTLTAEEKADLLAFLRSLDATGPAPAFKPEAPAAIAMASVAMAAAAPAGEPPVIGQKGKRFSMAELRLHPGQTLKVQNDDIREHNVRYELNGKEFNSGVQDPGQSALIPFPEPGRYHVFCGIHPKMKLDVDVAAN